MRIFSRVRGGVRIAQRVSEVAWIEQSEIRDRAARPAPDFVSLNPGYAEAHFNRGNALERMQRHEEALAAFDEALRCKLDFVEAWVNRANAPVEELGVVPDGIGSGLRDLVNFVTAG